MFATSHDSNQHHVEASDEDISSEVNDNNDTPDRTSTTGLQRLHIALDLMAHGRAVSAVRFSADQRLLATSCK